jgi:pSer/pThr/pTyr-binding forkhead associated (FHA) protein
MEFWMVQSSMFSNKRSASDGSTTNLSSQPTAYPSNGQQASESPKDALHIWRIIFQIVGEDVEFAAVVRNPVVIGRADPATGSKPDIDLTAAGGQEHGISRVHAILIPTDEGPCIIDLDTHNGTSINGQKLVSGRRYRLRGSDRLGLGSLTLMVSGIGIVPRGRTEHSTISINRKTSE